MERRSRALISPIERLKFWLGDYGMALLAVAIFVALLVGLLVWLARAKPVGPDLPEQATVVRFGYYDGKWTPRLVVLVRTRDNSIHQLIASQQTLRDCRRGEPIRLIRRGGGLQIHPLGCRRGPAAAISPDATDNS